jgi:hypothetical protein
MARIKDLGCVQPGSKTLTGEWIVFTQPMSEVGADESSAQVEVSTQDDCEHDIAAPVRGLTPEQEGRAQRTLEILSAHYAHHGAEGFAKAYQRRMDEMRQVDCDIDDGSP